MIRTCRRSNKNMAPHKRDQSIERCMICLTDIDIDKITFDKEGNVLSDGYTKHTDPRCKCTVKKIYCTACLHSWYNSREQGITCPVCREGDKRVTGNYYESDILALADVVMMMMDDAMMATGDEIVAVCQAIVLLGFLGMALLFVLVTVFIVVYFLR